MPPNINRTDRGLPRLALSPDEAAESTGLARSRIFAAIRNGEITARRDTKRTLIELGELQRWLRTFPTKGRKPDTAEAPL